MSSDETPSPQAQPKKSSFAGDVAKLASGTLFAQALAFLVMPILSRLFAPEAFGLVALYTSLSSLFIVVANLRYELAIMLPEDDSEAINVFGLSIFFTLVFTVLSSLFIFFWQEAIPGWLNEPNIGPYVWLLPISIFVGGLFTALNYWNTRTKLFGRLSIAQVVRSVTTSILQLGGGFLGYVSGGVLIIATVIGQGITTMVLGGQVLRDDHRAFKQHISLRSMWQAFKRYRDFPMYSSWSGLLNTASWQLPALLLTFFFSPAVVGYYALGHRVLRIPMSLLGRSISQVFFQRASEAKSDGTLAVVVENTFARLVRLGLFPSLILIFIGRDIFIIIFGAEWAEAGIYVQILSIWTLFWFISSPISNLFSVLERQDLGLYINILVFVSRVAALVIGGYLGNARLAILLFGISGIIVYGFLNIVIMHHAGVSLSSVFRILSFNLLLFVPFGIILGVLSWLKYDAWLDVFAASIIMAAYVLYVIYTDPEIKKLFKIRKGKSK